MELGAILLLLLSGAIHAIWNFLSKRSLDKQVFLWLALVAVTLTLWPLWFFFPPLPAIAWVFIVVSGAMEAAYFILLGSAYERGDLSLVYPLVRGSAPLFVTLFAGVFLGERVHTGGLLGILIIVAGIYTLHLKTLDERGLLAPLLSLGQRPSQLALLTGVATAANVVVDKVGVTHAPPLLYLYLTFVVAAVLLAPYMAIGRRDQVCQEWKVNRASMIGVGFMFMASYSLVLFVLTTSKVSYVSPVREVSVVFGALLGTLALREPFAGAKVLGSLLIFGGIVAIGLAA